MCEFRLCKKIAAKRALLPAIAGHAAPLRTVTQTHEASQSLHAFVIHCSLCVGSRHAEEPNCYLKEPN